MSNIRRMTVIMLVAAFSFFAAGCKSSRKEGAADHPKSEHPKKEHPEKSEQPKEHPKGEHPK